MARDCGCTGGSCGCLIIAGDGITVSGLGTKRSPYIVTAQLASLADVISFQDTTTIDFTVVGEGTPTDPYIVQAAVKAAPFPVYPTGGRPSAAAVGEGAYYYDSTLDKPIWSNGSVWKDAAGTTV
jgi:hypothetical protein